MPDNERTTELTWLVKDFCNENPDVAIGTAKSYINSNRYRRFTLEQVESAAGVAHKDCYPPTHTTPGDWRANKNANKKQGRRDDGSDGSAPPKRPRKAIESDGDGIESDGNGGGGGSKEG